MVFGGWTLDGAVVDSETIVSANTDHTLYAKWRHPEDRMTLHAYKAATCTEPGNNAYYTCEGCGKAFKDLQGTQPTTAGDEVIKALGHDWSGRDGKCKREGCGFTCDHNGKRSGVCHICGKDLGAESDDSGSYDDYSNGTFDAGRNGAVTGIWLYDAPGGTWSFTTTLGQSVKNSWVKAVNPYATGSLPKTSWFYFDENGRMLTGWQWIKDRDGVIRCYYLNPLSNGILGACWLDGRTPDGYMVDKDGAWTVNGRVQTR